LSKRIVGGARRGLVALAVMALVPVLGAEADHTAVAAPAPAPPRWSLDPGQESPPVEAADAPPAVPRPPLAARADVSAAAVEGPWRIAASPNYPGVDNHLQDVACSSATRCLAVGYSQTTSIVNPVRKSIAQTLGSGTWRIANVPQRRGADNALWSISCVRRQRCWAVGSYLESDSQRQRTLIARYRQGKWRLVETPNRLAAHNYLFGIECVDFFNCVAVGRSWYESSNKVISLVLTLADGEWTMARTPNRGGLHNFLADVSCSDVAHCTAVGYTVNGDFTAPVLVKALILTSENGVWTLVDNDDFSASDNILRDVACPTATTCVAVGAVDPRISDEQTLITTLTAGVWQVTPSPNTPGTDNHLWGISCPADGTCVAVGDAHSGPTEDRKGRSLTLPLVGGVWSSVRSPSRTNTVNFLYGVDCFNVDVCFSSGDFVNTDLGVFRTSILTNT
jgi:hypothetical protein